MNEINIKSSTVEKLLESAKDFLKKVIGPSADEFGLMIADNLRIRRLKNQLKNFEKVKKIVSENDISIKQVNLKVLVPYLDGISLEEDDSLQDIWANMFANYIDSSKNLTLTVYPSILKELSTNEVAILEYMTKNKNSISVNGFKSEFTFTSDEIANLNRLGLIEEVANFSVYDTGNDIYGRAIPNIEQLAPDKYFITDFGSSFLAACKR